MKNILFAFSLSVLVLFTSCKEEYALGELVTEDQVTWSYHETEVSNVYAFEHTTEGVITSWNFGNGQSSLNAIDTAIYAMAGTYTVTLTVLSNGGEVKITEDIVVPETNYSFMEGEFYDNLVGDKSAAVGKKWVMDRHYAGHLTMGENLELLGGWWSAASDEKAGKGLYDDTLMFLITDAGLEYSLITNGSVYANGGFASELGSTDGYQEEGGGDYMMPLTDVSSTWLVNSEETEISFVGGGFMGYFTGYTTTYNIITLEENVLEVANVDGNGAAWFQRFVTVDNLTSGEPAPPAEQVSITNLMDYFNGNSMDWDLTGDSTTLETAYTTEDGRSVAHFTRKADQSFAEMHTDLDGVIDFGYGVQIRMDVFVPESNVYTPGFVESWVTFPEDTADCMSLEVKLHNTEQGGNSYQTQLSLKTDVLKDYEGQWVTLVFDFNDVYAAATDNVDRDLMDRIIIQFGNEGWSYDPGISVYYDNIIGLETVNDAIGVQSASNYPVVLVK